MSICCVRLRRGAAQATATLRLPDDRSDTVFLAAAGSWGVYAMAIAPSGPNLPKALLLFAQFRPRKGRCGWDMTKRVLTILGAALPGYGAIWLTLLFVLFKLSV